MTAGELIQKLQRVPPETPIYGDIRPANEVRMGTVSIFEETAREVQFHRGSVGETTVITIHLCRETPRLNQTLTRAEEEDTWE